MNETQSSGRNESALEQNAFALPKHGRHRSVSAERSVDPSSAIAPSRHRHTQSVSSVHAGIPPPVYTARSQPIGLSRSTSLSSGGHALDPSASSVDESGTLKPKPRRASLHRSESLPAFPPDKSREQADVRRRESVSLDELAILPVCSTPCLTKSVPAQIQPSRPTRKAGCRRISRCTCRRRFRSLGHSAPTSPLS